MSQGARANGLIGWTAQHTSSAALASTVLVVAAEAFTPAANQCGAEVGRLRAGVGLVQATCIRGDGAVAHGST